MLQDVRSPAPSETTIVPINSLAPAPYLVKKPFLIALEPAHGEFLAVWYDAEIRASGETKEEAVDNFKDVLVLTYESLVEHDEADLGPITWKQLQVLHEFIEGK